MAYGIVSLMRVLNVLTIVAIMTCFMMYNTEPSEDNVHPVQKYELSFGYRHSIPDDPPTTQTDTITINVVQGGVYLTDLQEHGTWQMHGYENEKFYESECDESNADRLSGDIDLGTPQVRTGEFCANILKIGNVNTGNALTAETTPTLTQGKDICRQTAGCQLDDTNACVKRAAAVAADKLDATPCGDGFDCDVANIPAQVTTLGQAQGCPTRFYALAIEAAAAITGATDPTNAQVRNAATKQICLDAERPGEPKCFFQDAADGNAMPTCRDAAITDTRHEEGTDCDIESDAWSAALAVFWTWIGLAVVGTVGVLVYEMVSGKSDWRVVFGINCLAFAAHLVFIAMMLWAFSVENGYNLHESGLFKMLRVGHEDDFGYELRIKKEHGRGYYLLMSALLLSILSGCFTFFRIGHVYNNRNEWSTNPDSAMLYAKMSLL